MIKNLFQSSYTLPHRNSETIHVYQLLFYNLKTHTAYCVQWCDSLIHYPNLMMITLLVIRENLQLHQFTKFVYSFNISQLSCISIFPTQNLVYLAMRVSKLEHRLFHTNCFKKLSKLTEKCTYT